MNSLLSFLILCNICGIDLNSHFAENLITPLSSLLGHNRNFSAWALYPQLILCSILLSLLPISSTIFIQKRIFHVQMCTYYYLKHHGFWPYFRRIKPKILAQVYVSLSCLRRTDVIRSIVINSLLLIYD